MMAINSELGKIEGAVDVSEESLNKMDTTDLEAIAEQQDALAENIAAVLDRYGAQKLAVGCH
jgi:hypothetical protein